ncbi:gp53-like domain-containing protein [Burkholderia vietnamiensis]|uniref:gp53-like domain-containing protein n=1 Tax=Burkholderia vietnamiensis TaxID=60552 RepID=UPI001FC7D512|nr:hypothetical protein [Burkholderia vietnamiensis]
MTNLVETDRWEDGVYQLETSDPVVGGPEGIDNLQAKQLANRTRYLKAAIEARQSDFDGHVAAVDPHPQYATHADLAEKVAALVAQSPEALDTLSELAKALGNDPNFATTITSQLALKAAIDSPVFTGTPKAPTPPQFDNGVNQATTAFVQRALGNFQGIESVSKAITLTVADAGKAFTLNTGASITLPSFSTVKPGASFLFVNTGPTLTISRQGTDLIFGPSAPQNGALTSNATGVTLQTGDWCTITAMVAWEVTAGSPLSTLNNGAFGAVLGGSGYQKLPSGWIEQWGSFTASASGDVQVLFPIAFPQGSVYSVVTGANLSGGGGAFTGVYGFTASGFMANAWSSATNRQAIACWYRAVGK